MATQPISDPTQTVHMFSPDGDVHEVPFNQAHDALAAGGKPALRFQAPDGSTRYVAADKTQDALSAGGKLLPLEEQHSGIPALYGFTPKNIASNIYQGAKGIVSGSYDVAKDLINNPNWVQGPDSTLHKFVDAPSDDQVKKASAALESGNRSAAAGHILASAIPFIGPWAAGLGEQAGKGDIGGAVGQAAGTVLGGEAMARAPGLVKGAAGLAKTGVGNVAESVKVNVAPDPVESMVKALKIRSNNTGFEAKLATAFPDLKAAEAASGKPVTGFDDLLSATSAAKKAVWNEYKQKLGAGVAQGGVIDGNEIANSMEASVTARQAQLNPGLADRVKASAATYRRPMNLDEAESFLQDANNELHSYYAKNKVGQRVAAGDPETASTVAEVNQLRDSLYSKLDELTGPGAADIKKRYGALSNVEEEALRQKNVVARQQPESLAEQIGKASGYAKVGAGAVATLAGHPGGLVLAGEGAMQAGGAKFLKGRQAPEQLITNAFKNYELPGAASPSLPAAVGGAVGRTMRQLTGERGELGAPGSVSEENTAVPTPAGGRRSAADTARDITAGARRDPQLADVEAAQKARQAEVERRYPTQPGALANDWHPVENYSAKGEPSNFYAPKGEGAQDFGPVKTSKMVNEAQLYKGTRSVDLPEIQDRPLSAEMQKELAAVRKESPEATKNLPAKPRTLADLKEYEGFVDNDKFFGAFQSAAEKHLKTKGYKGAVWSDEDDLNPKQYQVWDKTALRGTMTPGVRR